MGLFKKIADAEAAFGKNYAKAGKYWILVDAGKKKNHQTKSVEMLIFETHIVRVLDNAEPDLKPGEALPTGLNAKGTGPKPMDQVSFVFQDGVKGNETRAKAFILKVANETDAKAITEADIESIADPNVQAARDVVLEVHATPQKTEAKKDIVAASIVRRISVADVEAVLSSLDPLVQRELGTRGSGGRLDRMIAIEADETAAVAG